MTIGRTSNCRPKQTSTKNTLILRRQRLFRRGAQSIAVAGPLNLEVPRFRQFRRSRIEILHECADLDLAIWMTRLDRLKDLRKAIKRGLRPVQETPYGGIAHHQLDVHLFDVQLNRYRGRLCIFGECPKPGKRECYVPNCGAQPFLQQFANYRFRLAQFDTAPKVTLFDRPADSACACPESKPAARLAHDSSGEAIQLSATAFGSVRTWNSRGDAIESTGQIPRAIELPFTRESNYFHIAPPVHRRQ